MHTDLLTPYFRVLNWHWDLIQKHQHPHHESAIPAAKPASSKHVQVRQREAKWCQRSSTCCLFQYDDFRCKRNWHQMTEEFLKFSWRRRTPPFTSNRPPRPQSGRSMHDGWIDILYELFQHRSKRMEFMGSQWDQSTFAEGLWDGSTWWRQNWDVVVWMSNWSLLSWFWFISDLDVCGGWGSSHLLYKGNH